MFCDQFSCIIETLAKLGRGSVLGAHTAANRGQRGRCPSRYGGKIPHDGFPLSHAGTTIKLTLSDGTELTHHVSFGE